MARTTDIADLSQLARRCKPLGNGHHAGWFRGFSGSMGFHKAPASTPVAARVRGDGNRLADVTSTDLTGLPRAAQARRIAAVATLSRSTVCTADVMRSAHALDGDVVVATVALAAARYGRGGRAGNVVLVHFTVGNRMVEFARTAIGRRDRSPAGRAAGKAAIAIRIIRDDEHASLRARGVRT